MLSKSIYKVPDGKLLKIALTYDKKNKSIDKISITGDFFAYPEESIETMENELKNTYLQKDSLMLKINKVIEENGIQFIGLDAESLTTGILMCLK